jgi:hypothetical protein
MATALDWRTVLYSKAVVAPGPQCSLWLPATIAPPLATRRADDNTTALLFRGWQCRRTTAALTCLWPSCCTAGHLGHSLGSMGYLGIAGAAALPMTGIGKHTSMWSGRLPGPPLAPAPLCQPKGLLGIPWSAAGRAWKALGGFGVVRNL